MPKRAKKQLSPAKRKNPLKQNYSAPALEKGLRPGAVEPRACGPDRFRDRAKIGSNSIRDIQNAVVS
jgi:hypothetical protein